jgi:predicted metal-dependent enzyme (double-stranded beta helix superfamily)
LFDIDRFVEDCRESLKEGGPRALKEIVEKTVRNPEPLLLALGEPKRAGLNTLYRADDLTVLNLIWGPGMTLYPHDHRMLAVIGLYGGREDNTFYRRTDQGLTEQGGKELHTRDTVILGDAVIHSVNNPLDELTGALHVYAGDFFGTPRSEWDPETLEEHPYDVEHTIRAFEESNRRLDER